MSCDTKDGDKFSWKEADYCWSRVWRVFLGVFSEEHLLASICLYTCVSSAPTGRICMISDIVDFYENPHKNSKFV
jgi:hypothetical protein